MPTEVRMPKFGQTMERATVVARLARRGHFVRTGQPVAEIETDKATMEVESPADGYVKHWFVRKGQTVPVGCCMLLLGEKDEKIPAETLEQIKADHPAEAELDTAVAVAEPIEYGEKLTESEFLGAGRAETGKLKLGQSIPLSRFQKITAERMLHSKRQIPCFYLSVKADLTELSRFREQLNSESRQKHSYNDFLIKAVGLAMEKCPLMAGRLEEDSIVIADSVDVGLAVALADSLIVPVIRDVANKDISQIACESGELIEKARNNSLDLSDLEGACITVSNLGGYGVDSFIPIVVPGQASILGLGRINELPVPEGESFTVRKVMNITLSVDHRIVNGAYAAEFLDSVRFCLEDTSSFNK